MVGAILFHFCDSDLITLTFAPHRLPRCHLRHPMPGDSQTNYLFLVVLVFTPKEDDCFMCRLRCLQSDGKDAVLFRLQCCLSGFTVYNVVQRCRQSRISRTTYTQLGVPRCHSDPKLGPVTT